MTSAEGSSGSAAGMPNDATRLHRSGPWLVTYGLGTDSEDMARDVAAACSKVGIDTVIRPVDDLAPIDLGRFFGLVMVLGVPISSADRELRVFERLLVEYRARHPYGLRELLSGQQRWFDVGIVQVITPGVIWRHPIVRALRRGACASHDLDEGPTDVVALYQSRAVSLVDDEAMTPIDPMRAERELLIEWGVSVSADVVRLRARLDEIRIEFQNNQRAVALWRPVPGEKLTALDLILQGKWEDYEIDAKAYKAYKETIARAQRITLDRLRVTVPSISRPGRGGDAVRDFYNFCRAVRIVDEYLQAGGDYSS